MQLTNKNSFIYKEKNPETTQYSISTSIKNLLLSHVNEIHASGQEFTERKHFLPTKYRCLY